MLESDKVVMDREVFEALASESRLKILKKLDGMQFTITDLAQELGLNKATIHKHLVRLMEANLVAKDDTRNSTQPN